VPSGVVRRLSYGRVNDGVYHLFYQNVDLLKVDSWGQLTENLKFGGLGSESKLQEKVLLVD
jgi:hypothetical protein